MAVQPRKKQDNIEFFEQRAPIWEANAATLNLSAEETAQLTRSPERRAPSTTRPS
ncbi:MAG: hypothetical protein ACFCBV_12780 [Phycisphaerales bacterium]